MSRLYLIVIFFLPFFVVSQKTRKLVQFADEQYQKGDYYYAIEYYKQALSKDSTNLEIRWKYAEALRAYKDYIEAEKQYSTVYSVEKANIYPSGILQIGLMQKNLGNYKKAIETFKVAQKIYENDKSNYLYKKAEREVQSTKWAITNQSDTIKPLNKLPLTVNSFDAEFGHLIYDNQLIFSSLRADSMDENEQQVYSRSYKTKLYKAELHNGDFLGNELINPLAFEKLNSGNGSFSLDGHFFYFSICEDKGFDYRCKIARAEYLGDGNWGKVDTLTSMLNAPGKNTTMPHIAKINDKEVLFFASDRQGSFGSLDIWYAFRNGNEFENPRNIKEINTMDGELTPWFDLKENKLYFSSSWHNGFGGTDIFYTTLETKNNELVFKSPVNLGLPINSSANDQYFFKHNDTAYISSNRVGSYFSKIPTCCSDIFVSYPKSITDTTTTGDKISKKLPVTLYFQNDEPDAKTTATSTKLNYLNSYSIYKSNFPNYKKEVSKGLTGAIAESRINELDDFFINYVDKGMRDLEELKALVLKELKLGQKITLRINGLASPLAKTEYNVNLTKRRIASLINYFKETDGGEFLPYINNLAKNGGKLSFINAPFGEFLANQKTSDNYYDQKNSVYSKAAAVERKIHIEEVIYDNADSEFPISAEESVYSVGLKKQGELITGAQKIKNNSSRKINFKINNPNNFLNIHANKPFLAPGEESTLTFELDSSLLNGFQCIEYSIVVEDFITELDLFLTVEIK
ncbi:MAG: tetratricopeptide repeat protein [Bacteroidetes bacterium]|nr:tetratricopeptide repeat protein [Bacteroidota bacterium]